MAQDCTKIFVTAIALRYFNLENKTISIMSQLPWKVTVMNMTWLQSDVNYDSYHLFTEK